MRALQRERNFDLRVAFRGIGYVMVTIIAFLLVLEGVIVVVRFLVG